MRIAAGFDHAGYPLKETIVAALEGAGHDVVDCGTDSEESVDYPVHAARAAGMVSEGDAELAVLACGSGTGVSIVANKLPGVRAVNARDPEDAEMARRHNDANVLALAGRRLGSGEAQAIIDAFLSAEFEGGRHQRRVEQIADDREWSPEGGVLTDLEPGYFNEPLSAVDPEVADAMQHELERQQNTLEMIASENFVPRAILEAAGSVLTNKYAEGLPGKRYYGGCEWVDVTEQLAIDRAKALFGAEHANVQPHAGAQANNAAYMALCEPGDTILGMELAHGGHLTHGMKLNVSGKLYNVVGYQVRKEDYRVDMEQVERLAQGAPAEGDRRGLVRLPAPPGLRRVPAHRRRGGGEAVRRHGALRGSRRRRRAPQPGSARGRGDDHDAQDAWRSARRPDPLQGGVRAGDRQGGVPRPAGRPAPAHHRREGGVPEDRGQRARSASASARRSRTRRRSARRS